MVIAQEKTLREIKDIFSFIFPGLKIEFYKGSHLKYELSTQSSQYDENLRLSEISSKLFSDEFKFYPKNTVAEIEKEFEDRYGIHIQIFRRSNDLWLQTSATDDWTLEEQNRKGLQSTESKII